MANQDFNIDAFVNELTGQVKNTLPDDIGHKTQTFIEKTFDKFLRMANEAIDNSDSGFSVEAKEWLLQVIAEWTFHKTIDLDRAKIPFECWESMLQKVAFATFEVCKQGLSKKYEPEKILSAVEYHVDKMYNTSLQDLFEKGVINKETSERAQKESNIDKMFEESQQKEAESKKVSSKNKRPKIDLSLQLSNMWKAWRTKLLYLSIACAVIITLVCVLYFGKSILAAVEPYKNVIIQIGIGIIVLAVIVGAIVYFAAQKEVQEQLKEVDEVKQKMRELVNPDRQYERLGTDILCLQISAELLPIADPDQEGILLPNTAALRQELTDVLGYIIPSIRIFDNSELDSYEYRISVRQQTVGTGSVYPNRYMVNEDEWRAQAGKMSEDAIVGVNPLTGELCSYWINKEDADKYPSITALEPLEVIKKHLRQLVIRNVDSIISTYDIEKYFETANKIASSQNITEKLKERLEPEDIRQVFANLIREEVSIKDILFVFDRLSDYSRTTKNPHILSEMLREDFARQISLKLADEDRTLYVVEFDKNYTKYLENNVKTTHNGQEFTILQEQINELIEGTAMKLMLAHQVIGKPAVVLCSPKFRQAMYRTLERYLPFVTVISQTEVVSEVRAETLEIVELECADNYAEEDIVDNEFYEQEPSLGRVIDSDGNPLDGKELDFPLEKIFSEISPADSSEPAPITKIFKTGVRAVDAFITMGYGQKMTVFAHQGCGLSIFLGLILKNSQADINIVSLAASSVEDAWSFINDSIKSDTKALRKTIVICSTPLDSTEKIKKNFETAVALCEYYRDKGKNVLFSCDMLELILNAAEKIAMENGEPACKNDYRMSVKTWYQDLINRCKSNNKGTITTIMSTIINSADKDNKTVNIIRANTQGHIFLSRKVAEQNIYPAIDILGCFSSYQARLLSDEQMSASNNVRNLMALYKEKEAFFKSYKYVAGQNPIDDFTIRKYNEIINFIRQRVDENPTLEESLQGLVQLAEDIRRE